MVTTEPLNYYLPIKSTSMPASRRPSRESSPRMMSLPTSPRARHRSLHTSQSSGTFGRAKLERNKLPDLCPVSSYSSLKPFSAKPGASSFATAGRELRVPGALEATPAHYADPRSTLKTSGVTKFSSVIRPDTAKAGVAPTHSYLTKSSSFTLKQHGTFATTGRESQQPRLLVCPVSSYAASLSTLRPTGAVAWGSTARLVVPELVATKPNPTPPTKMTTVKMVAALRQKTGASTFATYASATGELAAALVRPPSPTEVEDLLSGELDLEAIEASACD